MRDNGMAADRIETPEDTFERLKSIYRDKAKEDLKRLKVQCENGKLSLCIGSGVTSSLIGDWNRLLNEISSMVFSDRMIRNAGTAGKKTGNPALTGSQNMRNYIRKYGFGLPDSTGALEKGEYLAAQTLSGEEGRSTESSWCEVLFAQLTLDASRRLVAENIGAKVSESLEEEMVDYCLRQFAASRGTIKTLEAILELCFSGAVCHIVNYNFDTILERMIMNERVQNFFQEKLKSAYRPVQMAVYNPLQGANQSIPLFNVPCSSSTGTPVMLRIDHVHGILDPDIPLSPVVFSERSYLAVEGMVLHWSSIVIANAIMNGNLLCIGFSGEDEDFRTICRRIRQNLKWNEGKTEKEEPKIYILACLKSRVKKVYISPKDKAKAIKLQARELGFATDETGLIDMTDNEKACAGAIIEVYMDMVNRYYQDLLGVRMIWCEDYDQIADEIRNLRKGKERQEKK